MLLFLLLLNFANNEKKIIKPNMQIPKCKLKCMRINHLRSPEKMYYFLLFVIFAPFTVRLYYIKYIYIIVFKLVFEKRNISQNQCKIMQ